MKRLTWVIAVCFFTCHSLNAQKPVASRTLSQFQGKDPVAYSIFSASKDAKEEFTGLVSNARSFMIHQEAVNKLLDENPEIIRLTLPFPLDITLDLYKANVYAAGASILTSDGRDVTPNAGHRFYRGIIQGNLNSLAVVTIAPHEVRILISDQFGNRRLQKTKDGSYIMFLDHDLKLTKQYECFTEESEIDDAANPMDGESRTMSGNCVEVYVECDYESYQDNEYNLANIELWVATLWNEVITLYENEDIPVSVSDVFVYTSPDPFAPLSTTSQILNAFASHIDTLTYDGRLAHLLSTRPLSGGIAYINALCSATPCAFSSGLSTVIDPVPTYSWNVEVVTHEMGHNMGSPHTHACAWNGNNTQIDDCGNQWAFNNGNNPEGSSCFNSNAPILPGPGGGTIMSYCHLISGIGINFNNGFGTQPGNLIRTKYNNAVCNTGSCGPPSCTTLTDPLSNATNVDINSNISWNIVLSATGYRITIGTTPTNGNIANNLDVGLVTSYDPPVPFTFNNTYYVKIVPYSQFGDAIGCTNSSFTTEANVAPLCTHITSPTNGATGVPVNAIIKWAHSVGNQSGYYISIGTTLNGTDIVNHVNVNNNNFYDHPTSFPYATTLYVKINPYWANGEITNCTSQSFTTFVPVTGDFCNTAIDLPCGAVMQGSTLLALPDTGIPFCGVGIEAPGMWYKFVGNGQNAVIFTCTQYSYDTQLNVYSGTCNNLTCVAGIDDFCQQGSQLSFPTTNGTTYYVLVQGWNGAQGNYTISRTCYSGPFYCQSSGYFPTLEWIQTVSIHNFTKNSAASSYSDFMTGDSITLSRGGTYNITLTPQFLGSARIEYWKVWADLNHDGDFTDSGEELFSAGPSTSAVTGTVTIPVTALTGGTRMRVTMSHATITSSCGTFTNGEVEDYKLKLKCNLVTSTVDTGNGSLRNVSNCVDDGEDVLFAPSLNGQTLNVTAGPITVDGIWKWMPAAGTNITIKAGPGVSRILSVPSGKSAELQYLNLIGGTATIGNAIENFGTLLLRNCELHPASGSQNAPLRNGGSATIQGTTNIKF